MPTASTAATASSSLPGPTGSPAARKVRAKCIRLATSRPSEGAVSAPVLLRERTVSTAPHPNPLPAGGERESLEKRRRAFPLPVRRGEGQGEGRRATSTIFYCSLGAAAISALTCSRR